MVIDGIDDKLLVSVATALIAVIFTCAGTRVAGIELVLKLAGRLCSLPLVG
jgi:hypothetical protein